VVVNRDADGNQWKHGDNEKPKSEACPDASELNDFFHGLLLLISPCKYLNSLKRIQTQSLIILTKQ
jgi:hypothetical protein